MSYEDFKQAIRLAADCEFFTSGSGLSADEIYKAEQMLGIEFSPQMVEYYKRLNYVSLLESEIFGIEFEYDSTILEGNSLAYTLYERSNYGLPKQWIPIYNFNDGSLAFLDYSSLNKSNEPSVIRALYNGERYQKMERVAEDFGSFMLSLIEDNS